MKAFFVALSLVLAVAAAGPIPKPHVASHALRVLQALKAFKAPSGASNDTVQFLEGIELGLAADFGNLTECVNDDNSIIEDFDKSFQQLKQGFDHMNIAEIASGLVYFGDALQEMAAALKDCGEEELVKAIANLAAYLTGGPKGILELIAKEILNFYNNEGTLGHDYKQAIAAWDADPRDFKAAGFYSGEIIGIFLNFN